MRAGDLDQRITIETPTPDTNELGEEVPVWTFLADVAARVMETPGREFLSGDYQAEGKAVFCIRWRAAVDSSCRVTWRERVYRINDVTGTYRQGFAYLHCVVQDAANR